MLVLLGNMFTQDKGLLGAASVSRQALDKQLLREGCVNLTSKQ